MRGIKGFSTAVAAAALLALGSAQAQADEIGGHPNLNGVWQVLNTANWNLEPHNAQSNPIPAADRLLGAIGAVPAGLGVIDGPTRSRSSRATMTTS